MKEGSSDVCVTANLVLTTPFTTPLQILNRLKQVPPRSVPLHSLARSQAVAPTGASGAFETSEPAHRFLPPVLAACPYSTYTLPGTSDQWWLCEAFTNPFMIFRQLLYWETPYYSWNLLLLCTNPPSSCENNDSFSSTPPNPFWWHFWFPVPVADIFPPELSFLLHRWLLPHGTSHARVLPGR